MSLTNSTNVADVCVENSLGYPGWCVVSGITTMAAVGMLLLPAYRYTTNLTQGNLSSSEPESFLAIETGASFEGN